MNMLRHFSEEPLTGVPRTISIVAAVMLLITAVSASASMIL